jgi:hypothetical protein
VSILTITLQCKIESIILTYLERIFGVVMLHVANKITFLCIVGLPLFTFDLRLSECCRRLQLMQLVCYDTSQ